MNLAQILRTGRDEFPDAVAFHQGSHSVTYAQAFQDVERVAAHLWQEGIRPGQIVGVDVARAVSHWVMLLALLRLGAVSVSLSGTTEAATVPGLAAVITGPGDLRDHRAGLRQITIAADWLRADPPGLTLPPPDEAGRSAGRICFTSGTSGRAKAILLDATLLAARLSGTARRSGINARSVVWSGLGPDTAYGFTATLAAWLEGAAVALSGTAEGATGWLAARQVNRAIASPAALVALLRDAAAAPAPPRLRGSVIVAGGRLSVALRDAVRHTLWPEVLIAYGASETGGVTLGDADGLDRHPGHVGPIFADVEAVVVDEAGQPMPAGQTGQLRIRTSSLAPGYLGDPEATAAHYRDGWFQSGDTAMIGADRVLTMLGRPADSLNLGGVKLAADVIDSIARSHPDVEDACAVVLSEGRAAQLALVVVGGLSDGAGLAALIRATLPQTPRFRIFHAASLPRGASGKVSRVALAASIDAALAASAPEAGFAARLPGTF